jgi:hypothetical protein
MYFDGVLSSQGSMAGTIGGTMALLSGTPCQAPGASDNGDFNGYFDELRIIKGCAAWTASFTPPTAPYQ